MTRPADLPPGARGVRQPQGYTFWLVGDERQTLRDAYHTFLRLRWSASIALIAIGFFVVNLAFAAAYYAVGGVKGCAPNSFFDSLVFSVETLGTIGYGVMYPDSRAAQIVMVLEAIASIVVIALATGLVFTKFARATARVQFSSKCVITRHEGKPTLQFRVGNRRSNAIVDAQIRVIATLTTTTAEGEMFYKLHDLTLVRDRMPSMRRGWVVLHVIDETSPLHQMTSADFATREVELGVSLVGLDDVMMQTIHAQHGYSDREILFGQRFADTLRTLPNGDMLVDLRQFDVVVPEGTPRA